MLNRIALAGTIVASANIPRQRVWVGEGERGSVRGCCQTKANWSPKSTITLRSSDKLTPFGQGGGAVFLEGFAAVQMALKAEVIVD